jgi:DNA modification methylase
MNFDLRHGDCLQVLATFPDACVDAIVTDPPYGLAFMGKRWDYDVPSVEIWAECLRVLKPGGHLLAFAGTRTQHRMAVRIEDAGFEIRDMIAWVYGTGFNKVGYIKDDVGNHVLPGFGGSLKPALEPITMARKPFKGNVAANVLAHGTGAINVDGCRVGTAGRWPSNLIHDGSDEVVGLFPANAGASAPVKGTEASMASVGAVTGKRDRVPGAFHADTGSAARFFYTPKASAAERQGVTHPTVKPLDLMAYLCRLITPPNGTILDPFMGSGTTIKAAMSEGFKAIGIERDPDYFAMAQQRLNETQLGFQLL